MPSLFFPLRAAYAFFKEAWFLGSPSWTTEDIPDLTGQVFIVTGGNSGLGKETVRVSFILFNSACRNEDAVIGLVGAQCSRLSSFER
jgi:hypothetical protein